MIHIVARLIIYCVVAIGVIDFICKAVNAALRLIAYYHRKFDDKEARGKKNG